MGQLNEEIGTFREHDTEIIMISPDPLEETKEFWERIGQEPNITIALDPDFTMIKQYGLFKENNLMGEAIPATFVIDKKGVLRFKYTPLHYSDRPPVYHILEMISVIENK